MDSWRFNRVPNVSTKNRVPFQPGSEREFEEPCSPCSVFHVAADDVLIRLDPVAAEAGTWNLRPI